MKTNNKDSVALGFIAGLILPLVVLIIFSLSFIGQFESYTQMINHFQVYDVWYKVLSLALMPGAGLFFLWNKAGKINQARTILLMTLFYGVFVLILYYL